MDLPPGELATRQAGHPTGWPPDKLASRHRHCVLDLLHLYTVADFDTVDFA